MEICVPDNEKIKVIYNAKCPCCGKMYNGKERKKEFHHVIPKFMKPNLEVELTICKKCHEDINLFYDDDMIRKKNGTKEPENNVGFKEFILEYRVLRKKFKDKEIGTGEFGEGLWKNLVNHLQNIDDTLHENDAVVSGDEQ